MKSISIKLYAITIVGLIAIALSIVFYSFHATSKANVEELLKINIQTSVLNLKHYLDKNLKHNINEIKSHLDTVNSINALIANIRVDDNKNKMIYHSSRKATLLKPSNCVKIFKLQEVNVLQTECYSVRTKIYDELTPHYFTTYVFISQKYLDSLLHNQTKKLFIEYLITLLILLFLTWIIFSKTIKKPLEKLRQFAYYENRPADKFFIKEIESIRYSLEMTFKRLHQEQRELYNLSTRDQLSGLYNKRTLIEKTDWLSVEKHRRGEKFAVVFIDIDNFKTLNDSMGHNLGDKVLHEVAQILVTTVGKNDIVARIGGDEFVIVLPTVTYDIDIINTLEKIKTKIQNPSILSSIKYSITASMGVALFPKDGKNSNELLKNADIAMYKSKELGKNNYHFFTESLNQEIQHKVNVQNMLTEALEHNFFELHYQPKLTIVTNKVSACEALIRLRHPKHGLIAPNKFITIAEENGFIIKLGYWIIEQSVKQIKAWRHTAYENIRISINLSVKQFEDPYLIKELDRLTKDIDRSLLDIELTESVFVNTNQNHYRIIHDIKSLGFTLSLDDFGTGYSSLSYLKNISFDTIKIDKAFIDDLNSDNGKAFVTMIVQIAKTLHLEVVAEGVETHEQEEFLRLVECQSYQGYYCSKPLCIQEFNKLLHSRNYL